VHTFVRFGRPSDVIVETSREQRVGLIVLATSGRRGLTRWWEGSVADEVVRWADVPVLLVRASDTAWSMNRSPRLMVALDGSSFAEAVLEPAVELANALAAEVLLARVVAAPALLEEAGEPACLQEELARAQAYLDGIGGKLPVAGTVTTHVRAGKPPVAGLERLARDEGADLVALATHGRGGLARLALGSTTTAMLQQSPVPLLVVRPAGPAPYAAQLDLEAAAPIPASI
jgi:nucleotide-binding universal stress UspA family protein